MVVIHGLIKVRWKYTLCLIFLTNIIFVEVQDDNEPNSNYQSEFNTNTSPLNDGSSTNSDNFSTNTQQTNSSTSLSTANEPKSTNISSNDNGKTSCWVFMK